MSRKNCLDYLEERGHLPFSQAPFCIIDSLILSVCAYAPLEGVLPGLSAQEALPFRQAVDRLTTQAGWDHTGVLMADQIPRLVVRTAESPRFAQVRLGCCESILDEETGTQFAALTWFLPDGTLYLSFRGTDDSLVGWKECFRMAFTFPIPAQKLAEDYLAQVAARHPGKLRLGGHSKGGNLAVWAAVHAQPMVRRRILRVDSHDGPGFTRDLTGTPAYQALAKRIRIFVPQSSLVGALLHQDRHCQVIRSHGSGTVGQHDPFSWEVEGTQYRLLPRRSAFGRKSAGTVHAWLAAMSPQEQEEFVEVLFHLLAAGHAKTLTDITSALAENALSMAKAYKALDRTTRREIRSYLRRMLVALGAVSRPQPARPKHPGPFRRK
ncbi:Mbeg1-like protein [Evtepia sp.]|uniref:Mbeg1-like protein n=1 Tax=Evtepia sp. TaxID=2773933 RepID=UPI003F18EBF9